MPGAGKGTARRSIFEDFYIKSLEKCCKSIFIKGH